MSDGVHSRFLVPFPDRALLGRRVLWRAGSAGPTAPSLGPPARHTLGGAVMSRAKRAAIVGAARLCVFALECADLRRRAGNSESASFWMGEARKWSAVAFVEATGARA